MPRASVYHAVEEVDLNRFANNSRDIDNIKHPDQSHPLHSKLPHCHNRLGYFTADPQAIIKALPKSHDNNS